MKTRSQLLVELGGELNALLVASRTVMAASAARFHPGLQPAAYQLAVTLAGLGPTKAGALADLLGMDKSAISRLAKSLCDCGLAEGIADPHDRRGTLFQLTESGHDRVRSAGAIKLEAFSSRTEGWTGSDLILFTELLKRFNRS